MNTLLWVLQVLAALLYGASGVMKVFMFDKVWRPALTVVAAAVLAIGGAWSSRRRAGMQRVCHGGSGFCGRLRRA
jgi:hypothetical protein